MARSKSSKAWLRRHVGDPYVHKAKARGYRSRAIFKLIEISERDRLLHPGAVVIDLGAAPGGWSQSLVEQVGPRGRVVAVDLLEMAPISGATLIRGDFRDEAVRLRVRNILGGSLADLVVSDMAPNLSGVSATDQARSIHLCELALEFAAAHLKPGGAFLVKVFQGAGYEDYLAAMRRTFVRVVSRKPEASRSSSSEIYLLGKKIRNRSQESGSGPGKGRGFSRVLNP